MNRVRCLVVALSLVGSVAQADILGRIVSEPLQLLEPAETSGNPADVGAIVLELTSIDLRRQALFTYVDELLDLQADEESGCPFGVCNQLFLREIQARLDDARGDLLDLDAQVDVVVFNAMEEELARAQAALASFNRLFETLALLMKQAQETKKEIVNNLR